MTRRAYYLGLLFICSFIGMCLYLGSSYDTDIFTIIAMFLFGLAISSFVFVIGNQSKKENETDLWPFSRIRKLIFASFALALGISLLMLIGSMWIFGFEIVDHYMRKYHFFHMFIITIICFPIVYKYLK